MNKFAILGGVAVLALAIPAVAQMADHMQPQTRAEAEAKVRAHFAKVDVNKDGFITADEMKSAHEAMRGEKMAGMFDMADTNHDKTLTMTERMAAREKMKSMMMSHMKDGPAK